MYPRGGGGGGGGALPLLNLTVVGTCRWTGYDFPVITIDTGYLNRPNWLLAGYSVYHRVASQPHNVYDRPTISAPATVRARRNRFLWMSDDTQQNREFVRTSTNEPWINARSRNSLPPPTGYAYESFFSKVYCDRVYVLCDERFEIGSGFHPPPPSGTPLPSWEVSAAAPLTPGCVSFIYYVLISGAIHNWCSNTCSY